MQHALKGTPALGLVFAAVSAGACGGGPKMHTITIAPPPAPMTKGTLAGPLCGADKCTCRDPSAPADGGAGVPADGLKRFEVHVGPIEHDLWVTIDDTVLYKSEARAEECFYVDLAPGEHAVTIRAHHDGGISAAVQLREYAAATQSWYDTYDFSCGVPGVCAADDLDAYKASLSKYPRGIHDPCGSVKIRGLTWDTGVAPDQVHPNDLALGLTLAIYKFPPKAPHGDPSCATSYDAL
ncbi:MAG TPA: hypothetical protein VHE35_30530 [Kofleriaceae bacterium]|nr:hypothetical protein [Kofleriaceae bacterium]